MDSINDSDEELPATTPQKHSSTNTRAISMASPNLQHRPKTPAIDGVGGHKKREKSTSAESDSKPQVVIAGGPARPWEYQNFDHSTTIDEVLEQIEGPDGESLYKVQYEDGHDEVVS
ncbi:hypothetical protein PVAG01_03560 [Phlyctema vagabunda]|uniref:Uncharacterized protein n=1 Tax=Phlyctema vagabunda TaxID=108571 RepID=A0ABR4PLQ6_9HELO